MTRARLGYQDNSSGNLLATNQDVADLAGLTYGFGPTKSYWVATATGSVDPFGSAKSYGSPAGTILNQPVVGMASTLNGLGYWLVASDGGIFSYGNAAFLGSRGGQPLNQPIVGMAATPDGGGYWLVASDGGIFNYGDATFFGSRGGQPLNKPIVGMAATADGGGYWLVASDGGIFSYGDATFFGSRGGQPLNKPIVGMAATPDGGGYWLVASDGGIFSYGDAVFQGSTGGIVLNKPSSAWPRPATAAATGSSPPTAGSSTTAMPSSRVRPLRSASATPWAERTAPRRVRRVGCRARVLMWGLFVGAAAAALAPAGPGALVPLKIAIASADSVGNDVYVAVVVDFGSGSSKSTVSTCVPVASNAATPMRWLRPSDRQRGVQRLGPPLCHRQLPGQRGAELRPERRVG